jgi:hypothetical protein
LAASGGRPSTAAIKPASARAAVHRAKVCARRTPPGATRSQTEARRSASRRVPPPGRGARRAPAPTAA